jgi:hypothetical protein
MNVSPRFTGPPTHMVRWGGSVGDGQQDLLGSPVGAMQTELRSQSAAGTEGSGFSHLGLHELLQATLTFVQKLLRPQTPESRPQNTPKPAQNASKSRQNAPFFHRQFQRLRYL